MSLPRIDRRDSAWRERHRRVAFCAAACILSGVWSTSASDRAQDRPPNGTIRLFVAADATRANPNRPSKQADVEESASELRKRMIAQARFRLFPRGLEGFAPLAERSGYVIAESHSAVVSEQVLLRPRAAVLASQ